MGVTMDYNAAKKFFQKYIKCFAGCEKPYIRTGCPAVWPNKYASCQIVDTFTT